METLIHWERVNGENKGDKSKQVIIGEKVVNRKKVVKGKGVEEGELSQGARDEISTQL